MEQQKKKEVKIQVKGNDAVMGGAYANNHMVHMNRDEFVLDFINVVPPQAMLGARVILSPGHFKRLIHIMGETLKKYEAEFGKLPEATPKPPSADFVQ